jgi:hypothetical protein
MPSKKKDTADQLTLRTMRAAAIDRFGGPEVLDRTFHSCLAPMARVRSRQSARASGGSRRG